MGRGGFASDFLKLFNEKFYLRRASEEKPESFCCRACRKWIVQRFPLRRLTSHTAHSPGIEAELTKQGLKNVEKYPFSPRAPSSPYPAAELRRLRRVPLRQGCFVLALNERQIPRKQKHCTPAPASEMREKWCLLIAYHISLDAGISNLTGVSKTVPGKSFLGEENAHHLCLWNC